MLWLSPNSTVSRGRLVWHYKKQFCKGIRADRKWQIIERHLGYSDAERIQFKRDSKDIDENEDDHGSLSCNRVS